MSDNPKFEVIDRRKVKAVEEETESHPAAAPAPEPPAPPAQPTTPGPRLVVSEAPAEPVPTVSELLGDDLGPLPTPEESNQQKADYEASAQRVEDLIRAQNPAVGAQPPLTFESLVQQFYLTAMLQLGAGTQEGQTPRVDIVGARATIDLLGILAEKTRGNLTPEEDKALQTALFDARMGFLEISKMISLQSVPHPPPKR
ncbi:MAG TPA: DUF1844 domain-containing protein [Terracidiphilus sp.]|nr:DUF1844 domain-containing protein [Terracidiphilus sp.]